MKYRYGIVGAVVKCLDCDWETYSYKNAQAIAKIHAQKYRHRVEGELEIFFAYYGKETEKTVDSNWSISMNREQITDPKEGDDER